MLACNPIQIVYANVIKPSKTKPHGRIKATEEYYCRGGFTVDINPDYDINTNLELAAKVLISFSNKKNIPYTLQLTSGKGKTIFVVTYQNQREVSNEF
tara:strand:+ start:968 stop:1261 length:294 start_codon:yes stop_codon:yes gene_type:complete